MTYRALRRIETATHCVADLDACVAAYTGQLEHRIAASGSVPESLATAWGAPAMAGLPYALLQPSSGAEVYLRFIETGREGGYWPPVTQGWIASEILTTDPDAVLEKLGGAADCSPDDVEQRHRRGRFTHVNGPLDLYPSPKSARALQMAGPAGELMYFTRLMPGGSRFGLHGAKSFVDRIFIMVVGGTSLDALQQFYGDALGLPLWPMEPYPIRQMSRVMGAPEETGYPITMARIPGRSFMLELEELPADIVRRAVPEGELPEGLSMVSFATDSLAEVAEQGGIRFRHEPVAIACAPYNGRRLAVLEGPAGEWLELIE